ncbi:hypothetical protein, partial [Pseudomonas aeruginosa]|uniref:hypothetical protein n=1 Tax=Pseudomonas aeruginosa TaxID=287 RepID=UPI003CF9700F
MKLCTMFPLVPFSFALLNVIAQFCQYSNYQQPQDGGGDQLNDHRHSHEVRRLGIGSTKAQHDSRTPKLILLNGCYE